MKNLFRGYYQPNIEELDQIWNEGLIVLDTNALLNLFRYTRRTRDEFIEVLQRVALSLWIPHQVGLEFQKRRLDVIQDQGRAYADLEKAVDSADSQVHKALDGFRLHPFISKVQIVDTLTQGLDEVRSIITNSKNEYEKTLLGQDENDRIFSIISTLYESRVGAQLSEEDLAQVFSDGEKRYSAKVPPGYRDKDKPEPDRYGDLVLWIQLLREAAVRKSPALFITDDEKEDWWWRVNGRTQGARVELVDEYFAASGSRVHFYTPERFLAFAKKKFDIAVSEDALSEVEEVSREHLSRDTNLLFAQRANLQEQRVSLQLQIDSLLSYGVNSPRSLALMQFVTRSNERIGILDRELHDLRRRMIDSSDPIAQTIMISEIQLLSEERDRLEDASKSAFDDAEVASRLGVTEQADPSRLAHLREQLKSAEKFIRNIDEQIDEGRSWPSGPR
ncbi:MULTISPECIES: PIN-like domain-containing protein [unclassified Rathayibacter]|uniref:PIN-like domain-containing protein n=1 Tax=unclassified Rathayibacter TaxID=2609250 RepID=UPI000FB3F3EE|nr:MULTISPECIES: PIN-like domain-containing protein [unclassified Rathayibacter]ROP56866.1 hypothetical protein EDF45_0388 [Rathayibacter sp. PhB186]ROS55251.1 hypothetical protein EDF44_0388 [Rathayibacter sp. PhB185]